LYCGIRVGEEEAFGGPEAVFAVEFDAAEATVELLRDDGGAAAAGEGVEDAVAGIGGGEDELGVEFLGLLRGVVGVLGHRPEGHTDVVPEVGRVGESEFPVGGVVPVFGLSVHSIWGQHFAFHHDGIQVEGVVFRVFHGEPDVLHAVLPVGFRPAALLALPGDAVEDRKSFFDNPLHGGGTFPIAAYIERARRFQLVAHLAEPAAQEFLVIVGFHGRELPSVEVFVEIVGRVEEDEVEVSVGDEVEAFEQVAVDEHVVAEARAQVVRRADERFQRGDLPGGDRQRLISCSSMFLFAHHHNG